MVYLKKLFFFPFFLAFFATFLFFLGPLLNIDNVFITSLESLQKILLLLLILLLTSISFTIFAAISSDWKIIIASVLVSSLIPFIFFPIRIGTILGLGFLISALLTCFLLNQKLKTYLTFQPTVLLSPSVKQLAAFLVIISSLAYYLTISAQIKEKGFEIPDSLIDTAIKLSMPQAEVKGARYLAQITPEQLEFLKQNPDLLRQQGIDPSLLEQISTQTQTPQKLKPNQSSTPTLQIPNSTGDITKKLIKNQFNRLLEPYLNYIPIILSTLFFITLHSAMYFLSLLISPLIWLIFYILEKTNFIKYEKEMREVKKMVV